MIPDTENELKLRMNHKAIIFDLDNTLLDRTKTFELFIRKFIQQYFEHVTPTIQDELLVKIVELDEDGYKDKVKLFSELLELLPWQEKPQLDDLIDFYTVNYVHSAILMEDAIELLEWCSSNYKVGLITNGRHIIQDGKVEKLKIKPYFHSLVISESAGVKKPNKQIFDIALQQLELTAEECVYVGDHPMNDMDGASKAGMSTIWMEVNQPWREEIQVQPLITVRSLKQLLEHIRN